MYRPVLVTPPASTPVSLAEVKAQCVVEHSDDDALLQGLLDAAVSHLDGWTGVLGRCLVTQTWRQDFDDFRSCLRLPLFPAASIASVKYLDTSEVEQTVASGNYRLLTDSLGAFVRFADSYSFPSLNVRDRPAVMVSYVAGEAGAPSALKQAILLLVEHWYENRSAVAVTGQGTSAIALPFAVDALIAPFRRIRF